jgi:hypothetical protein
MSRAVGDHAIGSAEMRSRPKLLSQSYGKLSVVFESFDSKPSESCIRVTTAMPPSFIVPLIFTFRLVLSDNTR